MTEGQQHGIKRGFYVSVGLQLYVLPLIDLPFCTNVHSSSPDTTGNRKTGQCVQKW